MNFAKFLTIPFLTEHLRWLLLHVEKQKRVNDPISVEEQQTITLSFLATGESYQGLQYLFRIARFFISNALFSASVLLNFLMN